MSPGRWSLCALALLGLAACGERPTDAGSDRVRLAVVPVFRQGVDVPILAVDELFVRVSEPEGGAVLAELSVPVAPSDVEVEADLRVDITPGSAVVVEVALRDGGEDVYVGGPVATVPREEPLEIEVDYVGAGACETTVGSASIGSIGGQPGIVFGDVGLGDCYRGDTDTFADRWAVSLQRDAGLEFFAPYTSEEPDLRIALETAGGSVVVSGDTNRFAVFLAAGEYVVVVTTAAPLISSSYELAISEFDRCDSETGQLAAGVSVSQALTLIDCPLVSGRAADLWGFDVPSSTPYRIDLESASFDAQLLLTESDVLDPFLASPLASDDDRGIGTDALLAGEFAPGSYRVWATSFDPGETGPYVISVRELARGAPTLTVRSVTHLGSGASCGLAQAFLFDFGFEDGDGDLTEGGGVTIRLTGVPSGTVELKGLDWEGFSDEDLNPYAGYSQILTCETFGSDTSKLAEFFITDAQGRASAIYATTLTRPSGAPPAPVDAGAGRAVVRTRESQGGIASGDPGIGGAQPRGSSGPSSVGRSR